MKFTSLILCILLLTSCIVTTPETPDDGVDSPEDQSNVPPVSEESQKTRWIGILVEDATEECSPCIDMDRKYRCNILYDGDLDQYLDKKIRLIGEEKVRENSVCPKAFLAESIEIIDADPYNMNITGIIRQGMGSPTECGYCIDTGDGKTYCSLPEDMNLEQYETKAVRMTGKRNTDRVATMCTPIFIPETIELFE